MAVFNERKKSVIENNRLSGALTIASPAANGAIHFGEGQIIGAATNSSSGIEALKSFLDVTEGTFEFRTTPEQYPITIEATSNMSLMLDLVRVKVEEAATMQ